MKRLHLLLTICALPLMLSCASQIPAKDEAPDNAGGGVPLDKALADIAAYYAETLPAHTAIALLNFESDSPLLSDYIFEELWIRFEDSRSFVMADRKNLELIDKELIYQESGMVSEETALALGRQLGARTLVYGKITPLGGEYRLVVHATDVERAVTSIRSAAVIPDRRFAALLETPGGASGAGMASALYSGAGNPWRFTAQTDRSGGDYHDGDYMTLRVYSERDAWFKITHIDVNGEAQVIYPLSPRDNNFIRAGETRRIPDNTRFRMGAPYGEEMILAGAYEQPFVVRPNASAPLSNQSLVRGITVEREDATPMLPVATARFTYRSLPSIAARQKYALVIGNGEYQNLTRLKNPVNDANDMAAVLREMGFTVDVATNAGRAQMEDAVIRLKNRLGAARGSYGFFYYAGHGVQSGGVNYLIPVDANIPSEAYLRDRAVSMQAALDELNAAGNALNIVALDTCRDNPFSWRRSGSRGLQVVGNQPAKSIIVYATTTGATTTDDTGRNGLFTTHLLNNLKKRGLSVREMLDGTEADVRRASGGSQIPAIYSQFFDVAFLWEEPKPAPVQPVSPQMERAPVNMVRIQGGTFLMGSPDSEPERKSDEGPQHQVTVDGFYMGKYEVTVGDFRRFVNATGYKTTAETSGGGDVRTGGAWETKSDANWRNRYFKQGENHPVTLASWYDAIEYCNWRSREEGLAPAYTRTGDNVTWNRSANGYRLPTEAEWEYACRAGMAGVYSTGGSITIRQANYGSSGTKNVGSYGANPWGLYDMHGNVWEWCWDWYGDYGSEAQTAPAGAVAGAYRVLRGGSWDFGARNLRSANRNYGAPSLRNINLGFRLARP